MAKSGAPDGYEWQPEDFSAEAARLQATDQQCENCKVLSIEVENLKERYLDQLDNNVALTEENARYKEALQLITATMYSDVIEKKASWMHDIASDALALGGE